MIHVWDHFDFTGDTQWWRAQGWPLLKVRHIVVYNDGNTDAGNCVGSRWVSSGQAHPGRLLQ